MPQVQQTFGIVEVRSSTYVHFVSFALLRSRFALSTFSIREGLSFCGFFFDIPLTFLIWKP